MSDHHACPVCAVALPPMPRYPNHVCQDCAARAVAADGRALVFYNADGSSGYRAELADSGERHPSHACWIDGIACHADEARFGGIVVEVIDQGLGPADSTHRR